MNNTTRPDPADLSNRPRLTGPTPVWMSIVIVAFIYAVVIGIELFPDLFAGRPTDDLGLKLLAPAAVLSLSLVMVLVTRRRNPSAVELPPQLSMDRAQRRASSRALRPGGSVDRSPDDATRRAAGYLVDKGWSPWTMLGSPVFFGYLAYTHSSGWWRWMLAALAVYSLLSGVWSWFKLRRARAILANAGGSFR